MRRIFTFIDRYALIIAMVIGAVGYPWFRHLNGLMPPLICLMLFFTFCKVNPLDLRLRMWHGIVLVVQLMMTAGVYYGLMALADWLIEVSNGHLTKDDIAIIAQGLMVCVIMPTATAAPIIAGKLGGSIQNLTTFTLLSNLLTALVVPGLFPVLNPSTDIAFFSAMWQILCRVTPLLIFPFLCAWGVRLVYEGYHRRKGTVRGFTLNRTWASMPFYLWILLLVVLMARITDTLLNVVYEGWMIGVMCGGALVACMLQFALGRWIGYRFPADSHGADFQDILINPSAVNYTLAEKSRITAGQAFGQKNTALGIWMAQMFLHPLAAIAPAAYILWQNLLNSYQLWKAGKKK